jgi:hypothetical protein
LRIERQLIEILSYTFCRSGLQADPGDYSPPL